MRIAFVNTRSDAVGGSQVHVRDLAEALLQRGYDVRVFIGGEGPVTASLQQRGISCVGLRHLVHTIHPWHDARAIPEMCRALREFGPDLVSTHTSKAGVIGRAAARLLNIPSLFTAHGWNFTDGIERCHRGFRVGMERLCSRWSSRVITVSEADRQLALRRGVAPAEKLVTIHNGMPEIPSSLLASPARVPARIVMVARFEPQKDHQTLLQALGALQHLEWELELIGGGPLIDPMRELAGRLGIADRVRFAGPRTDVAERLAEAQMFALVSNWEGLPRSIIEAMRAGLPVVASDVGGTREMVLPGQTGYLVRRGDVGALTTRLDELLRSPQQRSQIGRRARQHYEDQFTFDAMFRKTMDIYDETLACGLPKRRNRERAGAPRVVHVVESYGAGTAEVIWHLANGMPEYHHVVVCGRRPESATAPEVGRGSNVSLIHWRGARRSISPCQDAIAFFNLLRTLRGIGQIGLLHAHAAKGGFHGRLAARALGLHASTLYTTHGSAVLRRDVGEWQRRAYWALEWLGSKFAGTVVSCSVSEHAILKAAGIPANVIANGVDDTSRPVPAHADTLTVATVARAAAQKDPAFFRRVAEALGDEPSLRFVWIGGGELAGELTCPNLTVTGWLDYASMQNRLSAVAVYLSTSTWEGLSLGVLHALALGKPVVLRRCTGNVDAVVHGRNGFLFDSVSEAVGHLKSLAHDAESRHRMGLQSRQIFLERFTARRMVEQYRRLYQALQTAQQPGNIPPSPLPAVNLVEESLARARPADRRIPRRVPAAAPRHVPHMPRPEVGSTLFTARR